MALSTNPLMHTCVAIYTIVAEAITTAPSTGVQDWLAHHIPFLVPILPGLFVVWTIVSNWDKIAKFPGVAWAIDRVKHRPTTLPQPKGDRFSIALAHLKGDNLTRDAERFVLRELKNFSGVEILSFDRELRDDDGEGHSRAGQLLQWSGADVLLWGEVQRLGGDEAFDLYWTARKQVTLTKEYARYEPSKDNLKLKLNRLADDVGDTLGVLVATAIGDAASSANTTPLVERIASLGRGNRQGVPETEALITLLRATGFALLNLVDDELHTYDEILQRFGDAPESALRERVATALFNKGVALSKLERPGDSIMIYDEVVARFGDAAELALRELVARALYNKGWTLRRLECLVDAITVYDDVVGRFGDAPELCEQVAKAIYNKGEALARLERFDDAIMIYDDVVERCGDAPELRKQVAEALYSKGVMLGRLGRLDDAVTIYDDVVARFGNTPELALREQVATALLNKGVTLNRLKRLEDAIMIYDDVVERFGDFRELRGQVARALINKGVTLNRLERPDDAITIYNYVVERFGGAPELALHEQVAMALYNKGVALGRVERLDDAIAIYDDIVERFDDAPELREQVAKALYNKGEALGRLERLDDATTIYNDVIARFGDSDEPDVMEIVAWATFQASTGAASNDAEPRTSVDGLGDLRLDRGGGV